MVYTGVARIEAGPRGAAVWAESWIRVLVGVGSVEKGDREELPPKPSVCEGLGGGNSTAGGEPASASLRIKCDVRGSEGLRIVCMVR